MLVYLNFWFSFWEYIFLIKYYKLYILNIHLKGILYVCINIFFLEFEKKKKKNEKASISYTQQILWNFLYCCFWSQAFFPHFFLLFLLIKTFNIRDLTKFNLNI